MDDSHKSREELIAELRALRRRVGEHVPGGGLPEAVDPLGLLDDLRSPLVVKDREHRWVFVNRAAEEAMHRDREQLFGCTDTAVYPVDYADFTWNKDEYVFNTGTAVHYELSPPWGRGRHCLAVKSRHTAADGQQYLLELLQDITEIKEIQRALVLSEGRMQSILNQSHVGVVVTRPEGVVYTNPVMLARSGYAASEVIGRQVLDFVHPEDRALVAERLGGRFSGQPNDAYFCYRLLRKDGGFDWIGVYGSTVDWGGEPAGLAFIVDLSEQKQAEDALARSETRLRRVVDLVPHAIYARHEDGRFLLVNRAALDLCGSTVDELTEGHIAAPASERVLRSLGELEEPVLSGSKPFQVAELCLQDADGRMRHLEYSAVPFPVDRPGRAVLGVCTDVTSRETMRLLLERFNDCLLKFGSEPEDNIASLVTLCGEVLQADCALYSRREGQQLIVAGQWRAPQDMARQDQGEGHICMDVIRRGRESVHLLRNLQESPYAETDPNVKAYGLKTYAGVAVRVGELVRGSLCVVFARDRLLSREDEWLLSVAASAIAVEERRMIAQTSLMQSEQTLRALADATSDMMVLLDGRGRVLAANARAAAAFGMDSGGMVGGQAEVLRDSPRHRERWRRLLDEHRCDEPVQFTERHDGRSLEHRVYPVRDEVGEVVRFAVFSRDITEALENDRRLAESEERFRTAFEQAAVGMGHISEDGIWLRVNQKLCDITGFSKDEMLGHRHEEVLLPEFREPAMDLLGRMLRGETSEGSLELHLMPVHGESAWTQATVALVRDEAGQPKYFSVVVEDISLRKSIQHSLMRRDAVLEAVSLAAEKFMQTSEWTGCLPAVLAGLGRAAEASRAYVFENVRDESGRLCMRHRFEWCDEHTAPQIGNEELSCLPYAEAGLDQLLKDLESGRPMSSVVSQLPEADRAVLEPQGILSVAVVPIFSGSEWWGFMGFDDCAAERDWTEVEVEALMAAANIVGSAIARRRTEAALHESERKFRIIADAVQDVFWISTPDRRRLLYLSPAFERQIGPRELLYADAQAYADYVHPDDRRLVLKTYARRRAEVREIEYRVRHISGKWVWVRERAFPVLGGEGEMEWLAGVTIDITDSRRAEEDIRRSLAEKELLLQEVHHRVKNNLQVITGLLDMAGRRIKDDHAREIMRDTQSKIQGMAMIHLQLYGCERFDSIDMGTYGRQLTHQLAQMYSAVNVRPVFELENIHLSLDKAIPCGLVLSELLSNVFKHAYPEGQAGVVELGVKRSGSRVSIRVADHGCGLPADLLEQELDSVGLKLLKNIVKFQLLGELHIACDRGTTMTISFQDDEKGEPSR